MRALLLILAFATAHADGFRLENFLSLLNENKVETVDQAVALLPADLRTNYVLFKESRGLQKATPLNPRAVLFGTDGRFVIAFNGDKNLAGYNALEMYQVNPDTSEFEFYRMQFPPKLDSEGRIIPPNKNPHTCMHCHTSNLRPIWNSYPKWPGAFAERDDLLTKEESELYVKFLENKKTHPRYSTLIHRNDEAQAPYRVSRMQKNMEPRPGTRMGKMVMRHNTVRVGKIVKNATDKKAYLPLLMYTLNGCKSLENPLPDWNWTAEDIATLRSKVKDLSSEGVLLLFGLEMSDVDLTVPGQNPMGLDYNDGSLLGSASTFLMGQLMDDFVKERSHLASFPLWYPEVGYGNGVIVITPFDELFVKTADSVAIPARFKLRACPLLLDEVRKIP